jgi:CRP/FNR family transcriptional regulator, cyclic AMP receptor protein
MDRRLQSQTRERDSLVSRSAMLGAAQEAQEPGLSDSVRQAPAVMEGPSPFNPSQLLAGFPAGRSERDYSPNESIFLQGDPANAVFYIERGEVKLSVISKNGKQAIVDILGENAFFGEGCLAGEPVRVATAIALQRSMIIRLEKRALLGMFQRVPSVAEEFITQLASRNLRMQADLADHIFNSSEKRLARLLLNLAKAGKHPGLLGVIPRISQETLAEMVGTTRSRVSFFLNRFRECGFISYNRSAIEVHRSLLSVLSGHEASDL